MKVSEQLKEAYKKMSDLTQPECEKVCRLPFSCCSPEYCDMTIRWAKEKWDVVLEKTNHPRLPLMGLTGCIAEPHLRSMCTLHTCEIGSAGFKVTDKKWTKVYFKIRSTIDKLEYKKQRSSWQ